MTYDEMHDDIRAFDLMSTSDLYAIIGGELSGVDGSDSEEVILTGKKIFQDYLVKIRPIICKNTQFRTIFMDDRPRPYIDIAIIIGDAIFAFFANGDNNNGISVPPGAITIILAREMTRNFCEGC